MATTTDHTPTDVTIVAHDIGAVGGMERQITQLISGLRGMEHRVTVIARSCELPEGVDVTFHRVSGPRRPFLLAYPWFMLAGSLAVHRRRRGIVQETGAIVLNRVDAVAIHYCHRAGGAKPSRPTVPLRIYASVVSRVKRVMEGVCVRRNRAAAFVCVSNGVADDMRTHYPTIADRVFTIHNGVDTTAFAPGVRARQAAALRPALNIAEGCPVAAFVGGEWGRKGLRLVLEALALAPKWHVVVAGRGDRDRYQALADALGVGHAVHWLGVVSDTRVLYELVDAFVLPSDYEAFALVCLEAAASGLPLIATPVNGVRELVVDGESGFLVARDPAAIAGRLTELAQDRDLRARMGESARKAALGFGCDATVERHHELYQRLARAAGGDNGVRRASGHESALSRS
jgi:UDP-glucose:(heptosyl)LPS alpha-1,3-glucosyltransferase